jgi:hypothetical protein
MMDRENPEKEEEGEGSPRTQCGLLDRNKNCPKHQEGQDKENQSLRREGEVKMA